MTTEIQHQTSQIAEGAGQELRVLFDLAQKKPRDIVKARGEAMRMLEAFPEMAETCFYSIPYKKWNKVEQKEETVFVEGPSIDAAMTLQSCWGNSYTAARIKEELDDRVVCMGLFYDAERNIVVTREVAVSKEFYSTKTKSMTQIRGERLLQSIQAGASKAVRNATIHGLPKYLVIPFVEAAKKIAAESQGKTIQERTQKMQAAFAKFGVTAKMIEAYMKKNLKGTTDPNERIGTMLGLYNSLRDGQADVKDVFEFPKAEGESENSATGATGETERDGGASLSKLMGSKKKKPGKTE